MLQRLQNRKGTYHKSVVYAFRISIFPGDSHRKWIVVSSKPGKVPGSGPLLRRELPVVGSKESKERYSLDDSNKFFIDVLLQDFLTQRERPRNLRGPTSSSGHRVNQVVGRRSSRYTFGGRRRLYKGCNKVRDKKEVWVQEALLEGVTTFIRCRHDRVYRR